MFSKTIQLCMVQYIKNSISIKIFQCIIKIPFITINFLKIKHLDQQDKEEQYF